MPNLKRKKHMSQIQCFYCKKFGHFISQCPKRFKDRKKRGNQHAIMEELISSPRDPKLKEIKNTSTIPHLQNLL